MFRGTGLLSGIIVAAMLLAATGHASADARLECVARCEAPMAACMESANRTRDACVVDVRRTCMPRPPAEQISCLGTAGRTCASGRSTQTQACRATFDTCHKACGTQPAKTVDYWCSLDFNGPNGRVYREWVCTGMPSGENPTERCVALLKDVPEAGYSLTCDGVM